MKKTIDTALKILGYNEWEHVDDSMVKVVTIESKTSPHGDRVERILKHRSNIQVWRIPTFVSKRKGKVDTSSWLYLEQFCYENGVHCVQSSQKGVNYPEITEIIRRMKSKGICFINAIGNNNDNVDDEADSYATIDEWIDVIAINIYNENKKSKFSNYGWRGEVACLNEFYFDEDSEKSEKGTSFASPLLAKLYIKLKAIHIKYNLAYTQEDFEQDIMRYNIDLGDEGKDIKYGYGMMVLPPLKEYEYESNKKVKGDNMSKQKWILPVKDPENWKISSEYGKYRDFWVDGKHVVGEHRGIDLAPKNRNADLSAIIVADCKVTYVDKVGNTSGYGKHFYVQIGDKIVVYPHLDRVEVNVGDVLKQGDLGGIIGSTGTSTNTHLHFEVRDKMTKDRVTFDPGELLSIKNEEGDIVFVKDEDIEIIAIDVARDENYVAPYLKEAWDEAIELGIQDGFGANKNVTEGQLMLFFKKSGFFDYIRERRAQNEGN